MTDSDAHLRRYPLTDKTTPRVSRRLPCILPHLNTSSRRYFALLYDTCAKQRFNLLVLCCKRWLIACLLLPAGLVHAWEWPSSPAVNNKDFTVLEAELPPFPHQLKASRLSASERMISHHIWIHGNREIWLCGSHSPEDSRGIFKLMACGQGKRTLIRQGRYLLQALQGQGNMWMLDESGHLFHYVWRHMHETEDGKHSIEIDGNIYLMRSYTPLESTCPI